MSNSRLGGHLEQVEERRKVPPTTKLSNNYYDQVDFIKSSVVLKRDRVNDE